jgi:hypothetical protein
MKEVLTQGRTGFCDCAPLSEKMGIAGLQKGNLHYNGVDGLAQHAWKISQELLREGL